MGSPEQSARKCLKLMRIVGPGSFRAALARHLPVRASGNATKVMSRKARLFLNAMCLVGFMTIVYGGIAWKIDDPVKFGAYLLTAMLASRLKVELPEITGTISVNFLFILIGIAGLSFSETLVLGCSAILAQCIITWWR